MSIVKINRRIMAILMMAVFIFVSSFSYGYAATSKLKGVSIPSKYKKGYEVINCLDISRWQSKISPSEWTKIRKSGVTAVIIRAGYSSYGDASHHIDKHFKDNIKNATAAGLEVGVYYFSAAVNKKEAVSEAEYFLSIIKPYKDKITLPVVLDFESNEHGRLTTGKMRSIGVKGCTQMCSAFLDKIAAAGYDPMIYANRATLDNYVDHETLQKKYKIWLAQYSSNGKAPTYSGDYYAWQYSSNVRLSGISTRFDANYIFKEDKSATAKVVPIKLYSDDESSSENSGAVDPDDQIATFNISDGVSSEVPITSNESTGTVSVIDKDGYKHEYLLKKANKDNCTETTLATLCSGYFKSKNDITAKFMKQKVLPAVYKDYKKETKSGKTISMNGIYKMLKKLKLHPIYKETVGDDIYTDIKKHLAKGKSVLIWAHTNNDKWGVNKNQIMLLIGMDENGYAILADPVNRKWSKKDQRVKLVSVTELVDYMKNAPSDEGNFVSGNDGGYILIDR